MNSIRLILLSCILIFVLEPNACLAQDYTSLSKHCGSCGGSVSISSKIGDMCPHCGVTWGRENINASTTKKGGTGAGSSNKYSRTTQSKTSQLVSAPKKDITNSLRSDENKATKTETENWIISKLKSYSTKKYSSSPQVTYIYSFEGEYLSVELQTERKGQAPFIELFKIPIYDIEKVIADKERGELVITTRKKTIIYDQKGRSVREYFRIDFEIYAETDLCERLQTAFFHLKKFYKKPISSEPF